MPSIETERLLLRKLRPADLDDLAALFADPDVVRYVGDGRATEQFIGMGGFRSLFGTPEVVYHLAKQHWGTGYATELARAALRFGFEDRGFERIVAIAKPQNTASIHVMEKLGMQFEKQARYYDIDVVQYQIRREDFSWQGAIYRIVPDTES
jgi:ribosomal-protein-alanine N-acetyltransferase